MKELEAFAENAVAVNRMILRHLSISEAYAPPPVFNLANAFLDETDEKTPRFAVGDDVGFCSGSSGNNNTAQGPKVVIAGRNPPAIDSSESESEQATMWMGLSPPGKSSLARRRMLSRGSSEDDQGGAVVVKTRSPPKTPSARF